MKLKIIGGLELLGSLLFFLNSATDIQLGFAIILFFMGVKDVLK
jgi:hypothetical protein